MVEAVKKSVAIGLAGVAAVVVAAWRQIQRDNDLATDTGSAGTGAVAPSPASAPSATRVEGKGPGALFTPSVSEKSTKSELYEVATELGIEGRSRMNKTDLLAAIRAAS